jgi:hypothetical protein
MTPAGIEAATFQLVAQCLNPVILILGLHDNKNFHSQRTERMYRVFHKFTSSPVHVVRNMWLKTSM